MKHIFILWVLVSALFSFSAQAADVQSLPETGRELSQQIQQDNEPPARAEETKKRGFFKRAFSGLKKNWLPGNFPSFLWSFLISAVGAYTIYGLVLGPLSVLAIYFMAQGKKSEVMKAVWGWLTGTALGLGIWILIKVL